MLLRRGADPKLPDLYKEWPIHLAESPGIVNLLVAKQGHACLHEGPKGLTPIEKFLKNNPMCAEAVLDNKIGTNGAEEDSKDLLITFDLSPFQSETPEGDMETVTDMVKRSAGIFVKII